jgi:hypothetical protein
MPQRASADGKFTIFLAPQVKGKTSGTASYTAVGKNCNLTVKYAWISAQ